MKLHVKLEMDVDEELFREAFHTANARETAAMLKGIYYAKMDEELFAADEVVKNVSVTVDIVEDEKHDTA